MKAVAVHTYVLELQPPKAYLAAEPAKTPGDGHYQRPPWRSLYSDRFETVLVRVASSDGTSPLLGGPASFTFPQSPGPGPEVDLEFVSAAQQHSPRRTTQ